MEEKNMNIEIQKPGPHCPCFEVNGLISNGKQFDLDITLPEDSRDVVFGTVKNVFKIGRASCRERVYRAV